MTAPICPTCNQVAKESMTQYGVRHDCCGLSSWGGKPLVTQETLTARNVAHAAFDPLWKEHGVPRKSAYAHLAMELGLTRDQTHMSRMDEETAKKVPEIAQRILARWKAGELIRPMSNGELLAKLIPFIDHKSRCDAAQPMWHKGPCDCGLRDIILLAQQQGFDIQDPDRPTEEVYKERHGHLPGDAECPSDCKEHW